MKEEGEVMYKDVMMEEVMGKTMRKVEEEEVKIRKRGDGWRGDGGGKRI